jgi:hypothetical protein
VTVKKNRGLPSTFQIDVPRAALDGPVQLGEYLDEVDAAPIVRPAPRVQPQPAVSPTPVNYPQAMQPPHAPYVSNVVEMPRPQPAPTFAPEPQPQAYAVPPVQADARRLGAKAAPRKQMNMNPETLRMVEELLTYIRTFSGQKDAKASEMFQGLVTAIYESKELLNFSNVQPRGQWGTPTAKAFPTALKNSFQLAIAEWVRRNRQ